jgi:hypothetical protein
MRARSWSEMFSSLISCMRARRWAMPSSAGSDSERVVAFRLSMAGPWPSPEGVAGALASDGLRLS